MKSIKAINLMKIVVFVLLFSFAFIELSYQYRDRLANTKNNISGFYEQPRDSLDVVLIGTSATFSAFAPMDAWAQRGFTSYNFCVNVMMENSMPYAITEVEKTQNPEVIVVDIAPFIFEHYFNGNSDHFIEEWARFNIDGYRYSLNRIKLINQLVPKSEDRWSYYIDFIKYHTNENPDLGEYFNLKKVNIDKGYGDLPWRGVQEIYYHEKTDEELSLAPCEDTYLNELLTRLHETDAQVLFINQPLIYQKEEQIKRVNYIKRTISESGFAFLDMTDYMDEIGMDNTRDYSLDYLHFTHHGTEKITYFLSKYLMDNYNLSGGHDKKIEDRWNAEYELWLINKQDYIKNLEELLNAT